MSSETKNEVNSEDGVSKEALRIERLGRKFRPSIDNTVDPLFQLMLAVYRERNKPWSELLQTDQATIANSLRDCCRETARKIFALAVAVGGRAAEGSCKAVKVDDKGIHVQLMFDGDREALVRLQGRGIALPLMDLDQFLASRDEIRLLIDADEPPLPMYESGTAAAGTKFEPESGEVIPLPDDTGTIVPPAPEPGQIEQLALPAASDLEKRRKEAQANPEGCGYRDALRGFNASRNPLEPGTEAYQRYEVAHARGEIEREKRIENGASGRRRRRRGSDGAADDASA